MAQAAIRRWQSADWRAYRNLRLDALADAPDAFASTLEREQALTAAQWRARLDRSAVFAAYRADMPVGTVAGVRANDAPAVDMVGLWVRPDTRRQKIADLLVCAVLDWADARRCERVRLWVVAGNEPARCLYARHGFLATGEIQAPTNDPARQELAMARIR